jgi:nitrite reductase/ring-hydroxylating ferredoxin subunit
MSEPKGKLRVCAVSDVESGAMLAVEIEGLPKLAVYRVGDEFYCSADMCTHGAASLTDEGDLDGYVIECTWHDGKFDIRTGAPCALPCTEALRTFPVSVEGSDVFIEVV